MEGNILTNRSKNRRASDYYPTPEDATQALIDYLRIPKSRVIWECACGEGFMAEVFKSNGYQVISTDLNSYGYEDVTENFLESKGKECDWIITNPPFSLAEQFIRKCIEFHKPFAMLLKSQYWHSKKRLPLFRQHPPAFVLPLTWRPDFEFGLRGGSPTMDCIWTVWGAEPCDFTVYEPLKRTNKKGE